jgi:Na+/proline symporter
MYEQLTPQLILGIVGIYFLILIGVAYFTGRNVKNDEFFVAGRKSPWYVVSFGMIGASLSGVTFISIPGVVGAGGLNESFSYMQVVFGYLLGYFVIATVLMPVYYKLNLTSIYTYLEERFGKFSYKAGASFFLFSRVIGASFRLFLVALVLQQFVLAPLGVPLWITVAGTVALIWVYTFQGGMKTIIWTDTLQTFCMLLSLILTVLAIGDAMSLDVTGLINRVRTSEYSQMFFFENGWADSNNFFKQFLSGASIAIVMTGLDQDMMQKNLSCKNIGDAQKNMFWFSITLVFVNLVFLILGALLYLYAAEIGMEMPMRNGAIATDLVFPTIALQHLTPTIGIVFFIGLIAAAYSSADSALTALTTSFCVDILGINKKEDANSEKQEDTRRKVHIGFSVVMFAAILLFSNLSSSVINDLFKIAGFTYGPLLGLFTFGFFTKYQINDRLAPIVCVAAPIITYIIDVNSKQWFFGYKFGFELLILNGLITFLGLLMINTGTSKANSKPVVLDDGL